jgi:DHA3 family macrolide efflux protein-like MFS transporter
MIVGGALVAVITMPKRRIVVLLVSFAVACATVALAGLTPSHLFWLATVWWFTCGLAISFGNAPAMAIIQTIVPNELQGRALSLFSTLTGLAAPLGLLLVAPLGQIVDVRGMLIGGGILATLVCLTGFLSPALMKIDEQPLESPAI